MKWSYETVARSCLNYKSNIAIHLISIDGSKISSGKKVWLDFQNLNISLELSLKWLMKWIGPFPIERIIYKDTYVLNMPRKTIKPIHVVFQVFHFKMYY